MHIVGYLYEDYHDAQSLEHKVLPVCSHEPASFWQIYGMLLKEKCCGSMRNKSSLWK
jgi:hypothetical protein